MNSEEAAQILGKWVHLSFSIFSASGVPVALGENWILLDEGSMIHLPSISQVSFSPPPKTEKAKPSNLPLDLKELF